jgi:hypothetical protein
LQPRFYHAGAAAPLIGQAGRIEAAVTVFKRAPIRSRAVKKIRERAACQVLMA